jgi:hypothetical protein
VLPFDLIEVLDAPTPFIIGVHSDQKLQALTNVKNLLFYFYFSPSILFIYSSMVYGLI